MSAQFLYDLYWSSVFSFLFIVPTKTHYMSNIQWHGFAKKQQESHCKSILGSWILDKVSWTPYRIRKQSLS